ncbi:MAG: hypothetical protein HY907_15510 [Deltaproteobacteria bacterium]|nr:hypothetical protein [Deltaproteobacteria bacterium]
MTSLVRRSIPPVLLVCSTGLAACGDSTAADAEIAAEAIEEDIAAEAVDADAADRHEAVDDAGETAEAHDVTEDVPEEADVSGGDDAAEADVEDVAPRVVTCADEPPPGAELPDPLPSYALECPTLVPGRNTITSTGAAREFLLVVPAAPVSAESFPVIVLWHWLGGEAANFVETGEVQVAADAQRFLAVVPEAKGDLPMKWPFGLWDVEGRVNEEVRFFDDMLACVAEQFAVNRNCVSTVGVSAGGLWVPQLAQRRSRILASFLVLSGGVGQDGDWLNPVRGWVPAGHHLPALVLWGGPTDFCGLEFQSTSRHLEDGLVAGGHFLVECVHNCSHAVPPFVPPPGESTYAFLWRFAFDHPYWLRDGESPYQVTGLPAGAPEWCGLGAGSAAIRVGSCEGGILGECM